MSRIQEIKDKVRLTSEELQQVDMDLEENQGEKCVCLGPIIRIPGSAPPVQNVTPCLENLKIHAPSLDDSPTIDDFKIQDIFVAYTIFYEFDLSFNSVRLLGPSSENKIERYKLNCACKLISKQNR